MQLNHKEGSETRRAEGAPHVPDVLDRTPGRSKNEAHRVFTGMPPRWSRYGAYGAKMPDRLLRFFDRADYAHSFIAGEMWFGRLDRYRSIEGSRRDDSEGRPSFFWDQKAISVIRDTPAGRVMCRAKLDGNIYCQSFPGNAYFILCTSRAEADRRVLARKFGEFVVCIDDPPVLLERIRSVWRDHAWALEDSAFLEEVAYNKDETIQANPHLLPPMQYSYAQKPRSFEEEREFRYVLACAAYPQPVYGDSLTLRLPDCSDICSMV